MLTLLYFVLILGLTIFIHELGHFIWAKKAGIYCYEFSLGMGPIIYSFNRKNDETKYAIRLFPIGGFVQMAGESVEEDESVPNDRKFHAKKWSQRFMTIIAGVLNNYILAIFLFFILAIFNGATTITPIVGNVDETSNAYGLIETTDVITKINGKSVHTIDNFLLEYQLIYGEDLVLEINNEKEVSIKPILVDDTYIYGFGLEDEMTTGLFASIKYAFLKFYSLVLQLVTIVIYLFTGVIGLNSLSGPIGIYTVVGQSAQAGVASLIYLTAYLSINVGIINLLPIPAFDGGRLLFLIIEKIKGSPVSPKTENYFHFIGFILLMILMVYITFNDIVRFF